MTLKNLLTTTEKTIQISNFRIVSRLRCVIFILISFICILSVQNSFSQEFECLSDANKYPTVSSGESIPLSSNDAVLLWSYSPAQSTVGRPFVVLDASIVTDFNARSNKYNLSSYGYTYIDNDSDVRYWASVVSPSSFYSPTTTLLPPLFSSQIQDILAKKNLGTIIQRSNFISLLRPSLKVEPVDFSFHLSRWILLGISIFIAIPLLWWVIKRFLK